MNVGTRYPEGRIVRPREIGGRHVRKEQKRLRKGGPEGLRKAHEARAGHGPEDAGAQGVVQGDREGAGQVALDGERRGGVAVFANVEVDRTLIWFSTLCAGTC